MLFSLFKYYLDLYITDNAPKVSPSLYYFTTSISHGIEIISPGCGVRASLMPYFAFDAPKIWNELPDNVHSATSIASFRKKLKLTCLQKPICRSLDGTLVSSWYDLALSVD